MAENPPLANLITLGAWDFTALRDFYRRLGWPQVIDEENFAAFELRGTVLAVFPIADLARDGNTDPAPATGGISFTIGVLVDSAEEVDQLTGHMRAAGARVTKDPVDAEFLFPTLMPSPLSPTDRGLTELVHDVPVTTKRTTRTADAVNTLGSEGLNVAVSWCSPGSKREVVSAAVPLVTTTGGPRRVVPSWNCTVLGANAGFTVAVSVTRVPWVMGDVGEVFSKVMVNVRSGIGCDLPMLAI
jgi:predicted lactoylglutathione lyase